MADGYVQESAGQLQPSSGSNVPEAERTIVQEAVEFLAFVKSYEDLQRKAEDEQLEFKEVDMWTPEARDARREHTDDEGHKIPSKPTLSVDLADQHIQQIVNEARQARLALSVKPKAGIANTKYVGYFKGALRDIQVASGAPEVRLWAFEHGATVGRGAYMIDADYANDGDFDLDLFLKRFLDQSTVYFDPYASVADYSDGERCLVTDWMSVGERIRRWPNKPLIPPANGFENENDDWFAGTSNDPKNQRVRWGAFYKVIHTIRILGFHPQFGRGWLDGEAANDIPVMPPEMAEAVRRKAEGTRTREVDSRSVRIYVIDGTQVLEEKPWLGRYIPVIPVIGKESVVKGKRRFKGVLANVMDLMRAINVVISAATEVAAMMPRSAYIMYAGQDDGFESEWDELYIANRTRVHVNQVDIDGKPAPLPQRQQMEIQVQGLMFLLRMLTELFHSVTGSVSPQQRAVNPYDRSGKAIEALQRQGAAGTSNYLDNLATISMPYEGKVLVDAIPKYYDKPGRILRFSGEEHDNDVAIMIKVPFVRDQDGNPMPVPCPMCAGSGQAKRSVLHPFAAPAICPACRGTKQATKETMPETYQDQEVEYVDFSEGEFKIQPVIDRNYQVKQEEALAGMTQLAQAAPELVPAYAADWVRAMGFSGANTVADAIEAAFPRPGKELGHEKVPPRFLAQFTQLQQQHQQAMLALQEAQKLLETDAIKQAGAKELAVIKAALTEKVEQIKVQGRMLEKGADHQATAEIETLRGHITTMQQEMQGRLELLQQGLEHKHEILLQLLKEKGAKEEERHSVELHDAAAAKAAERAELSATNADVRQEITARSADARADASAAQADHRAELAAERAAQREAATTQEGD